MVPLVIVVEVVVVVVVDCSLTTRVVAAFAFDNFKRGDEGGDERGDERCAVGDERCCVVVGVVDKLMA